MKFFHTATTHTLPANTYEKIICVGSAGVLVVLALAQLFSFEKFPEVLQALGVPGSDVFGAVYAALIVLFEIFALPALLGMRLSPLMRGVSIIFGCFAWLFWLVTNILTAAMRSNTSINAGLFGDTLHIAASWWAVVLVLICSGLFCWAHYMIKHQTRPLGKD